MNGQLDLTGYDLANLDLNSVERIDMNEAPKWRLTPPAFIICEIDNRNPCESV